VALLVTGGTGFLGSYFTRHAVLEHRLDDVVVLDRYADRARIGDVLDHVVLIEDDVTDGDVVRSAIEDHGVDRVAHFAFILGSPPPGLMVPYVQVQCVGTATVFEAARNAGVARVLFCSSVAAYGRQNASVLTEDLVPNPVNPYGSAKAWGEALGRHYTEQLGLEVVTLRFGSTYGFGRARRGSYSSGLLDVPRRTHFMATVDDAVHGEPIELPPDDTVSDWTYAADAAHAVWLALTTADLPHHLYNVRADRKPVRDFKDALLAVLPDARITTSAAPDALRAHPAMDASRLADDLGFAPRYSLQAGVRDYVARIRAYDSSPLRGA
jgi:nucleoside-diphosphate-sugar epimerase